ncbi:Mpo1-like protein [Rufibacter immobilis]|uniref:Mpo1-like protein n=1 Tax=Rufibacter immobilis TaxID=1348778 RepID=UPI0035E4B6AA
MMSQPTPSPRITSFKEFYPFYLQEHQNTTSRVLHFTGTGLLLILLVVTLFLGRYSWLWLLPVIGYGFAWVGHFFFEKNKPATFQYPFYSLASDFVLFFQLLTGKQKFRAK